ncbi:D-alanyl-D-alanine-carboxypeptidase/endopeptidase AmpH precursor [Rubripirellula amarantea]|uniref:Beta-lactamase n=1 Tax=Rubripirellula amarantea TaxID=2527999 RepID=A0A5C5WUN9_9BACT|nr:serine hydrolase [Rubripirellula amarantea]TWT53532.1 D-alanyl-D-alanine-carboxypeptidase/endopeptidase AmpH precursor [Rubripirellula amarantea]
MKAVCTVLIACVTMFLVPTAVAQDARRITPEQIDRLVKPYLDAKRINAISIGVIDGDVSLTHHLGTLSRDIPNPPTDQTIYEIGSISKVFTSLLLASEIEAGNLKLTSTVGELLPDVSKANPALNSVQLVQLATHTSGLPRMPANLDLSNVTDPYATYSRESLHTYLSSIDPAAKPGEKSEYSNLAVGLLGDVLAMRSGDDYDVLIRRVIAEPLGMTDTGAMLDPSCLSDSQKSRLAPPHDANLDANYNWHFASLAGAGSVFSTTSDMLRFAAASLDPPDNDLGKAMRLSQQKHAAPIGSGVAMGLGWHFARDKQTLWHNGQTGGYHTMLMVNPKLNAAVVVLCNTAMGDVDALAGQFIQTIAGMNVEPKSFDEALTVPAETVARLAGQYEIAPGAVLTVRADQSQLFAQLTGQPEVQIFAISETKWKYRVVEATIEFELPDSGPASSLTLFQSGMKVPGKRK